MGWWGVKGTETNGMDLWAAVEMKEKSRKKSETAAGAAMVDGELELWDLRFEESKSEQSFVFIKKVGYGVGQFLRSRIPSVRQL